MIVILVALEDRGVAARLIAAIKGCFRRAKSRTDTAQSEQDMARGEDDRDEREQEKEREAAERERLEQWMREQKQRQDYLRAQADVIMRKPHSQ